MLSKEIVIWKDFKGERASSEGFVSLQKMKDFINVIFKDEKHKLKINIFEKILHYYNKASDIIKEIYMMIKGIGRFR